jgi:histidinol-phosphate aminotransferase
MIRAKPDVERLTPYVAPLEGRRNLLRLDFNENTVGPSPKVIEAIRALSPSAYATYPEYAGLVESFADSARVDAINVAAFNGVDAAIRAIFDAYGEAGATFLTTTPTFGYYAPCAQQQGMILDEVPYPFDLTYPHAAVAARLAASPRLFFVCNPNNPTGTMLDPRVIVDLARSAPRTLVVVDELYVDFTGRSVVPAALALDNVVVLRSLSKSAGIAALRLGFAIAHATIVERLTRVIGPYDINAFAVAAGKAALADPEYMQNYVAEVLAAKDWTIAELARSGVRHFADGGNYLLVWPPGACDDVVQRLRAHGILVRSMAGKPVIDGSFRLTIGTREQMTRFMTAFADVLDASARSTRESGWTRSKA